MLTSGGLAMLFLSQMIGMSVCGQRREEIGRLDDVIAVSYTHLDVYKRQ